MTTIAMIAGMLPIAMGIGAGSEARAPMAISVVGGLITATLLTLLVIPVVFTYIDDFQNWLVRVIPGSGATPHIKAGRLMQIRRTWRNIPLADRFRISALLVVLVTAHLFQVAPALSKPESSVSKQDKTQSAGTSKSNGTKGKGESKSVVPVFSFNGAKEVDGLVLQQEYRFIGKSTTYFSPLGIRLESTTLSVLFNSKTQVMCIYSDETKNTIACDPQTWKKKSKVLFKNPTEHM